jgi:predicted nucleotidyltransferase
MALPALNDLGELPLGIHAATLAEVVADFGHATRQREEVTARLVRIHAKVQATGKLVRFVVFGSYVTDKPEPNDVDVVMVMRDDFNPAACESELQTLFDHRQAADHWGASVFWICSSSLIRETVDQFLAHWQIKRDRTQRGIVEVVS